MNIRFLPRHRINDAAWNGCVAASSTKILYGYSWYLDAVTSTPGWSWAGLVINGEQAGYQAVMPVPLRRKWGRWVVHQPLFCQVLGVFSRDAVDPEPFFAVMQQRFRYGSILHSQQIPDAPFLRLTIRQLHTHVLDLSLDYPTIARRYSSDRNVNLRRTEAANWTVTDSTDPEPLIQLFQTNHAGSIPNGVAPWAYTVFRTLFAELHRRHLTILRYALKDSVIQAGALFVREGNRIIYLFNAATPEGRTGNARTLLIDQIIRGNAGQPVVLDFESPEKSSIAHYYASFGAVATPFWEVRYNRLTWVERWLKDRLRRGGIRNG